MSTTVTDVTLPLQPGRWLVDTAHSGVHFQVKHLGLANVRGRFDTFDADVVVGPALSDVAVNASIDLASINTNQADRDAHLRSTDFFAADEHPQMTFRSSTVEPGEDGASYELHGELTVNGVTRPVTFDVEFNGTQVHPGDQHERAGFTATGHIDRRDYGVDFNLPLGAGQVVVGNKVRIELDIELIAP